MQSLRQKVSDTFFVSKRFIQNNGTWLAQGATFSAIVAVEAYLTYDSLMQGDAGIYEKIARTLGAAIKITALAVMVPLSPVSYTNLQNSAIGRTLALDKRIIDHKIFSTALIGLSTAHAIAHFCNNPSVYFSQAGINGAIMLSSVTVLPAAGMLIFKRFSPALRIHQAGVGLFVGGYFWHAPDWRLVKYATAATLPFAIDRLVKYLKYTHSTKVLSSKVVPGTDFLSVEIEKPAQLASYAPGQYASLSFEYTASSDYAQLAYESINKQMEAPHPFTITHVDADKIGFLIKRQGDWTKDLFDYLTSEYLVVRGVIRGPFGRSLVPHGVDHSLTMIGSGIGITPMLALLNFILQSGSKLQLKPVNFHIIQKKLSEAKPCLDLIKQIDDESPHLEGKTDVIKSIHLYLTAENDTVSVKQLTKTGLFASRTHVNYRRPDFNNIMETAEIVSACGSPQVIEAVNTAARRFGVSCYNETF